MKMHAITAMIAAGQEHEALMERAQITVRQMLRGAKDKRLQAIADEHGISVRTLKRWLAATGVEAPLPAQRPARKGQK